MWMLEKLPGEVEAIMKVNYKKKMKKIKELQDKRDCQMFDYVYGLIKNLEIFNTEYIPTQNKCNVASENFLVRGKGLLSNESDWKTALEWFTLSIMFAEANSETMGMAYTYRSQLFLEHRLYDECIRDIDRSLKCHPPDDIREEIQQRRQQVEEKSKAYHKTFDYHGTVPCLPGTKNKRIRCASKAIGLASNEKLGQYVEARRDISIGEVIVIEEPYNSQIRPSRRFLHCHECLDLCYDLIPCLDCTLSFYCSNACRAKAREEYHKYECILFQYGLHEHKQALKLALKMVINYNSLQTNVSTDEAPTFRSNCHKYVSSMKIFKEYMTPEEIFQGVLDPIIFYHFLTKYTDILRDLNCPKSKIVLKEILVRNSWMMFINNIEIMRSEMVLGSEPPEWRVGNGIYPFYLKFHHSCFCNTRAVFYGKKMVIHALANIKKGENVTTDYGVQFFDTAREDRKKYLGDFLITCQCPACENDWPLKSDLSKGNKIDPLLISQCREQVVSVLRDRCMMKGVLINAYKGYTRLQTAEIPSQSQLALRKYIFHLLGLMGNTTISEE